MDKNLKFITLVSLVLFIAGCTKNLRYIPRKLKILTPTLATSYETKNNVTVCAKPLTLEEQKYYFGALKKNQYPIQISIDNKSSKVWALNEEDISLPLIHGSKIIKKYQAGYSPSIALGFFFFPLVGVVHGVYSHKADACINQDLGTKVLLNSIIIEPNTRKDFLVFTPYISSMCHFVLRLKQADEPTIVLDFTLYAA